MKKYYDTMPRALRKGKSFFLICMLTIPLLGYLVFYIGINFNSFFLAFQRTVGIDDNGHEIIEWTGEQFLRAVKLFGKDSPEMLLALRNTLLYFSVCVFGILPTSFILSYFFYKKIKGTTFFRVAIYLPNIISTVAIVIMFKTIIAPNGPLADILKKTLNYELPALLRQESTAIWTMLFYAWWAGLSGNLLLFQGAFRRIPAEVVEAAQLDGANAAQELFLIMIPMMWSTLSTIIILSITNIFGTTGPVLIFTQGAYNTATIDYWIYEQVKELGSYNLPSAMGLIFTSINLPIVFIVRKLFSLREDIEY